MVLAGRLELFARTGRATALVFDSALALSNLGGTRTQLAEGSRAEASWVGVYAGRFHDRLKIR